MASWGSAAANFAEQLEAVAASGKLTSSIIKSKGWSSSLPQACFAGFGERYLEAFRGQQSFESLRESPLHRQ